MALMIERNGFDDDSPWTDDELDMLDELSNLETLVIDDDDFEMPSDEDLTEWSEDADALDSLTELFTEVQ